MVTGSDICHGYLGCGCWPVLIPVDRKQSCGNGYKADSCCEKMAQIKQNKLIKIERGWLVILKDKGAPWSIFSYGCNDFI